MNRLKLTKTERTRFQKPRRLEQLQALDPIEFERYCGYLYRKDGYAVFTTAVSGDEGVDLVLKKRGQTTVVQCKRYAGTVGQPTVRDLYGTMLHNGARRAALVTSGRISPAAERWAGDKQIDLIDGHELVSWARRQRLSQMQRGYLGSRPAAFGAALVALMFFIVGGWTISRQAGFGAEPAAGPDSTGTVALSATTTATAEPEATAGPATATAAPNIVSDTTGGGGPRPLGQPLVAADLSAPRFGQAPVIDGFLDDWPAGQAVATAFITEQAAGWDGTLDLTALWQLGWDNDYLFIAVTVSDDTHVQTQAAQFAYLGDSVEVQIDADRLGDLSHTVSDDDFQYVLSPGDFNDRPGEGYLFIGSPAGEMVHASASNLLISARQTGVGYTLEAALPWAELGIKPASMLVIGIALSANDNDRPGSAAQMLMLSHVETRKWADPSSWGTLTLQ